MAAQLSPALSQRIHWSAMVGLSVHVPLVTVSCRPCCGVPEMVGGVMSLGPGPGTIPVIGDWAGALMPLRFDAVTWTAIVEPASPPVTVYLRSLPLPPTSEQ